MFSIWSCGLRYLLWVCPGSTKRKIGEDGTGDAVFAATGEEKRNLRKADAATARDAEYERMLVLYPHIPPHPLPVLRSLRH